MSTTPTEPEVLRGAAARVLADVRVCAPARVVKFDASTRRCSAKLIIPEAHEDEDGERVIESLPVIVEVPVGFYGSGGCRIKIPVSVGDEVLLLFSRTSLDAWLAFGEVDDPEDDRTFHLSDAVAIVGFQADATDAFPMIEFTSTQIQAGGSEKLALRDELNDLRSTFNAHSHPSNGSVPDPPHPMSYPGTQTLRGA